MKSISPALAAAAALAVAAFTTIGCASATTIARPSPFPGTPDVRLATGNVRLPNADDVVRVALALRGTAYRLGGDSPSSGFDCSGLVRYVFGQEAIGLPRTVAEQFVAGIRVQDNRAEVGDLVFFSTTARGPTHVGIVVGGDQFVHAPGSGGVVRVERLTSPYWSRRLVGVRRVADVN